MKITVEKVTEPEKETKVDLGQIYTKYNDYYMVTKASERPIGNGINCNLTNLNSGGRFTEEMPKDQLSKFIETNCFKLVNVSEIIIKEII